ncbi:MAG: M48 family metallopeptidase [Opitutales bacterium]|nr:M48 family metallopeptidase [Opitutales bacterium]
MQTRFESKIFDGKSSEAIPVTVTFSEGSSLIHIRYKDQSFQKFLADFEILEPIGKHHGILMMDKICEIEIPSRKIHRSLRKLLRTNGILSWVDNIERSWPLILTSVTVVVLSIFAGIRWGLPWLATEVAFATPEKWVTAIGENGLNQLNELYFEKSELSEEERDELEDGFREILRSNGFEGKKYQLHFKQSDILGANAMALPSGDIVLLDGLIELGLSHEEVLAVFAHEIAHVEMRHGIQLVVRYAGIGAVIALIFGDVQSGASILAVLPKIIIEKGYSREFESEADRIAVDYLIRSNIDPHELINALRKLGDITSGIEIPDIISSHPDMDARVADIEELISQH